MRQIGRYRVDHVLGSGAFATVWKGHDPELDAVVAIKVLADNWSVDADVRERFTTEARLLRRIESPRVVRVHDVGVHPAADGGDPDRPYFVMDYIEGGTLADWVGRLPPEGAVRLACEAAYAVQVLHDFGVVHRDLKPSNLLVDSRTTPPRVVVADLGSAKMLADASGFTVTTGTPAYMAPEQAGQVTGFDGRADVYALGVITYELLCGRRPFAGPDSVSPAGHDAQRHPAPLAGEIGVGTRLDGVLASALDREPGRRPPDPATFGRALEAAYCERSDAAVRARAGWPMRVVLGIAVILLALGTAVGWLLR
jgi:eukaryotic-like serine/threonine-protein kinase